MTISYLTEAMINTENLNSDILNSGWCNKGGKTKSHFYPEKGFSSSGKILRISICGTTRIWLENFNPASSDVNPERIWADGFQCRQCSAILFKLVSKQEKEKKPCNTKSK